jgi:hypothetical protein
MSPRLEARRVGRWNCEHSSGVRWEQLKHQGLKATGGRVSQHLQSTGWQGALGGIFAKIDDGSSRSRRACGSALLTLHAFLKRKGICIPVFVLLMYMVLILPSGTVVICWAFKNPGPPWSGFYLYPQIPH